MRYGFIIVGGDPHTVATLAQEAEAAGWDGAFYFDAISIESAGEMFDPWLVMTAMALKTERLRIGAIITPLSRRRPWKVARETVTLDHISGGRLIVPVGLGALDDGGFAKVGEVTDRRVRAELLDEGLDILTGLWSGKPFHYDGAHYHLDEMTFLPPPVQSPRIPIWVVGAWPRAKSMQRVVRYDGLMPNKLNADGTHGAVTPDDIRAMADYVATHRTLTTPFDIIMEGRTPGDDHEKAASQVRPWAEAGATWWMEAMWEAPNGVDDLRTRIHQGPPRVD